VALKKSEKRLLGMLGVVLVIFLLDRFIWSADKKEEQTVPPQVVKKGAVIVPGANSADPKTAVVKKKQERTVFRGWKKDPFAYSYAKELAKKNTRRIQRTANRGTGQSQQTQKGQQTEKKEEEKGPVLNGILWKNGKAFALIDGVIMEEGEEREGLRVVKIRGSEVICRKGNRTFTIQWRESQ